MSQINPPPPKYKKRAFGYEGVPKKERGWGMRAYESVTHCHHLLGFKERGKKEGIQKVVTKETQTQLVNKKSLTFWLVSLSLSLVSFKVICFLKREKKTLTDCKVRKFSCF